MDTELLIGIDTETTLISKDNPVPDLVCVSLYTDRTGDYDLIDNQHFQKNIKHILDIPGRVSLVFCNAKFDLQVLDKASEPDITGDIFDLIYQGKIKDIVVREKLLNLAEYGSVSLEYDSGNWKPARYSLAKLVNKYCGVDISEDKTDTTSWRYNYETLKDTPIKEWPEEAIRYAKEDAKWNTDVYKQQEVRRKRIERAIKCDPLESEDFRLMVDFALSFMTKRGVALDTKKKEELDKWLSEELDISKLDLLVKEGILIPGQPELPYASGAKNPDGTVKMKKAIPEKISKKRLTEYVEAHAKTNPLLELEYNPPTEAECQKAAQEGRSPHGNLKLDAAWLEENAPADPLLQQYQLRQSYQKLLTTEMPRMTYLDEKTQETVTAAEVRPVFDCLKETGRVSSYSDPIYPSFNCQNVHPKARECYVPREDCVMWSVDFSQMELGTAAQTMINLFGESVLADKINKGFDVHAYLGCNIAKATDAEFNTASESLHGDDLYLFFKKYKKTNPEFYNKYRKLAKPTGLGFPGGLGPATMVKYAQATYGVEIDLMQAKQLREIWLDTFPEFKLYFDHITNVCKDPNRRALGVEEDSYCYKTPLGMYRANTKYCAQANGMALQSPGAEGSLLGMINVVRLCYDTKYAEERGALFLMSMCWPLMFIHDELVGEMVEDKYMDDRYHLIGQTMVEAMQLITPDVKASYSGALMRRWNKKAEYVADDNGRIKVWENAG